jgi:hypothetical protein
LGTEAISLTWAVHSFALFFTVTSSGTRIFKTGLNAGSPAKFATAKTIVTNSVDPMTWGALKESPRVT